MSRSEDLIRLLGAGHPGEVRVGPGGRMYAWVEAFDSLGNELGGDWTPWEAGPDGRRQTAPLAGAVVRRLYEQAMGAPLPPGPAADGPEPPGPLPPVLAAEHGLLGLVAALDRHGHPVGGFWLPLGGLGTPPSELTTGSGERAQPGDVRWADRCPYGWVATAAAGFWTPLLRPGRPPRGTGPRVWGLAGFGVDGGGLVGVYQASSGPIYIAPWLLAATEPAPAASAALPRRADQGPVMRKLEQALAGGRTAARDGQSSA